MALIGRTWEDETPEIIDRKIGRLLDDVKELETDKKAFYIANDGKRIGKPVVSVEFEKSWSVVEYKGKFYTLTCGQSSKGDALVAWCDVHEGESLYEEFKKKYGAAKW